MAKVPGQGAEYKAVNDFNKTFPEFLKKVQDYTPKALDILCDTIDNPNATDNLRHGAANKIVEMSIRYWKEFRNATPKDFVKDYYEKEKTGRSNKKRTVTKGNETSGFVSFDIIEDTGTD